MIDTEQMQSGSQAIFNAPEDSGRTIRKIICYAGIACLFLFAISRFVYDAKRLISPVNDLTPIWVSSQAFATGQNPYSNTQELDRIWAAAKMPMIEECKVYDCILHKYPMGYPPSALPIILPFATLSWKTAMYTYLGCSIAFFVGVVLMLAQELQLSWSDPRKLFFVAFALAMAPIHAGIHHSNLNTVVISCLFAAVALMNKRPYSSGLLLAVSMCLKPQVAFLFFAYPWLRKQWKTGMAALGGVVFVTLSSILWLRLHHVEVFRSYLSSLSQFMPAGGINSFYMTSPRKYTMINMQVLVYQLTHQVTVSNVVAWLVFLSLTALAFILLRSESSRGKDRIDLALISVLTLLPVYQQIYTAAILVFVVYWAVAKLPLRKAQIALLLMLPLLLPLVAMTWSTSSVARFVEHHDLGSHFYWNAFLMPHVIWIELLLATVMLTCAYDENRLRAVKIDTDATGYESRHS